jgi:hypothetical protein
MASNLGILEAQKLGCRIDAFAVDAFALSLTIPAGQAVVAATPPQINGRLQIPENTAVSIGHSCGRQRSRA